MANINKIRLSGQTYDIQDPNASKTVELTQAEYDALETKDTNTFYIITDAEAGNLSNYYTKSETSGATEISTALASKADTATTYTKTETDNAITAATSTKQDTLVSGTNIKTINGETLLGEGNITIEGGGGSITVDQSLDSASKNAVANSAITKTIYNETARFQGAASYGYLVRIYSRDDGNAISIDGDRIKTLENSTSQTAVGAWLYTSTINGKKAVSSSSSKTKDFSLVETSAITNSVTSSSTDSQVPSAKAVYDMVGNINTILESI